tara:strand:- start:42 stop:1109 length:1068 start_codon:yes stop_codon:yes gene_type:complete
MVNKTIVTVTGIRPDFIRMLNIFKLLDDNFNHVLIHTGQHFDSLLSGVFFDELEIRPPDYNLSIGGPGKEHFHQTGELSTKLIELLRKEKIKPDIILFLGDSNSVTSAVPLKKEGYTIGHVEAGMRSGDKRMLEEINRTVCDHCSDYHFVYHEDYKQNLVRENLPAENIYVVGNTIVEVCGTEFKRRKELNQIILDIHRPENFKYKTRLANILFYANLCMHKYKVPVKLLKFGRTMDYISKHNVSIGNVELVDLMPYKQYLKAQYDSLFLISDSGTGQEEPALLQTPVIVPRDYTERPQSMDNNCSVMINVNTPSNKTWSDSYKWINSNPKINSSWLGTGQTSQMVCDILRNALN